jgi:hypothetical protein
MFAVISGMAFTFLPIAFAAPTIKCYSDVTEIGDAVTMPDVRNTTFKVAVAVENVTDFYGFDIQINWTTQWIHYLSYTVTVPRGSYPSPIPPSPYAGILNGTQYMQLSDIVDENDNISGADFGAMAWIGYSSMNPAPSFTGSGTAFVFTFNVTDQPYDYEAPTGVTLAIHFVATALSTKSGTPITHTREDLAITLYPRKFTYPAVPKIRVSPSFITGYHVGDTFDVNVTLLGADNASLDPFWDVAGIEFYLNFNSTYLQAINCTADPDGTFDAFWSSGTFALVNDIEPSYVDVAFMGLGETHTPVSGTIRIAKITFNVTYLPSVFPNPIEPIYLENPAYPSIWYILDSDSGIIDLSTPVVTEWTGIYPRSAYDYGFNLTDWTDKNGDGELSLGDQMILLNKATMKTHDYKVDEIKGTMKLEQKFTHFSEERAAMDGPVNKYTPWLKTASTGASADGIGVADWTGNFSLTYPVQSVNYFEVHPLALPDKNHNYYNGTAYNLTENVDFKVNPDGTIDLLTPLDTHIINETGSSLLKGSPGFAAGWPDIKYIVTSFEQVAVDFNNGSAIYQAANYGFEEPGPPPSDYWYEDWWPYELESWWTTDNTSAPWLGQYTWPDGSQLSVNYTAASFIHIDYKAKPDTQLYFIEWPDDYSEFLTLADPTNTTWMQIHPAYNKMWNATSWEDVDSNGNLTVGDRLTMMLGTLEAVFEVKAKSTDIKAIELPCVQDVDTEAAFYTEPIIVSIAGFPRPDRTMSPWFGRNYALPLPHEVENSEFEAIPEFSNLLVALFLTLPLVAVAAKLTRKKPGS